MLNDIPEFVIETHGLTRYYGARPVVAPLDLRVPRGSIFGFLGRNGAGKSTTIRMLMGLVPPTRGSATVLGYDCTQLPPEARARIGYLAEGHHVFAGMRVEECGQFQSRFYSHWNRDIFHGVIAHFGLSPKASASGLSRGERAGLCLALTLAPEPELLVLDDPALGLDPVARRSLLQSMLYVTRRADRTILFSSHLLSDVERVADHIAIMQNGVLRAQCSVDEFRQRIRQYTLHFAADAPPAPTLPGLLHASREGRTLVVTLANPSEDTDRALAALSPLRLETVPLGLEDAFLDYMGERRERTFFLDDLETSTQ